MAERAGAPAAKKAKHDMEARVGKVRQQGNIKAWLEKVPLVNFSDNSRQERALRANIFKEVLVEQKKCKQRAKEDYGEVDKREVGAWVLAHGLTGRSPSAGRGA